MNEKWGILIKQNRAFFECTVIATLFNYNLTKNICDIDLSHIAAGNTSHSNYFISIKYKIQIRKQNLLWILFIF
jgi:hypothetical protein